MSETHDDYTQGKCPNCNVGFRFTLPLKLKDAFCPDCGQKLNRTTHLFKGEWRKVMFALRETWKLK